MPRIAFAAALLIVAMPLRAFAAPIESAPPPAQPPHTIEVDGSGEAHASPDIAYLSVQIETHATTADQAASANAELAQRVTDVLKSKLGGGGKVYTGGYSLNPEYDQRPNQRKPGIIGYTAQNSISVETGQLKSIGALIDSAIAAGANRVNYLNFSLKEDVKARAEAIGLATKDAQAQAQALAGALGMKLGRVVKASTVSQVRPIPMPMMEGMARMAMAPGVATPVEAGEVTVPATVFLIYEIE